MFKNCFQSPMGVPCHPQIDGTNLGDFETKVLLKVFQVTKSCQCFHALEEETNFPQQSGAADLSSGLHKNCFYKKYPVIPVCLPTVLYKRLELIILIIFSSSITTYDGEKLGMPQARKKKVDLD